MPPEDDDLAYLWDILRAARAVETFVREVTFHRNQSDELLRSAVERKVEIIGEASSRLSSKFRDSHPGIPWRRIIAQRNVLIHEYGEIVDERIYEVAVEHIPLLIRNPEKILPADFPPVDE